MSDELRDVAKQATLEEAAEEVAGDAGPHILVAAALWLVFRRWGRLAMALFLFLSMGPTLYFMLVTWDEASGVPFPVAAVPICGAFCLLIGLTFPVFLEGIAARILRRRLVQLGYAIFGLSWVLAGAIGIAIGFYSAVIVVPFVVPCFIVYRDFKRQISSLTKEEAGCKNAPAWNIPSDYA